MPVYVKITIQYLICVCVCVCILQEVREMAEVESTGVLVHMSHHLQPLKPPLTRASKQYCDKCAQIIWGVIHVSYVCSCKIFYWP